MSNDRLRSTVRASGYSTAGLAEELDVDPKTVQRWMTRADAASGHGYAGGEAAERPAGWRWPDLDEAEQGVGNDEVVGFYPHRAAIPKVLWRELLVGVKQSIDLVTYAVLHLIEDDPETLNLLLHKSASGVRVRIAMGDPDAEAIQLRGLEERMPDGIVGRVRMANAYYAPLIGAPGVDFRLHQTTLYNSIHQYDDQVLVNHHGYGRHGYLAPVLHLRRAEGGDLFDTYMRSFDLIRGQGLRRRGLSARTRRTKGNDLVQRSYEAVHVSEPR